MSGIAVIFNRDESPLDRELLARIADAAAWRGPDGIHLWTDGAVGLGHAMLATTPEALHESQPLHDDAAGLCLTIDGRVDNRDELAAAVTARGCPPRDDTDAELVLRAYQCWGESSPEKILGDFAYAIWDARRRRLFCARDVLGMRTFYYYASPRIFIAASELRQILECPLVTREPNEGMIGEFLSADLRNRQETFYRDIRRLPGAHALTVDPARLSINPYYDLRSAPAVCHRSDAEYAEHFHDLFREAVRCRLRASGPVGVGLSGGLDSSSVAAMGQRLRCDGAVTLAGLETFSIRFTQPHADERSYMDEMIRHCHLTAHGVEPFIPGEGDCREEIRRYQDLPGFPNGFMGYPLTRRARERGCRVILDGVGGDHWLTGSWLHYADLLRHLRLVELVDAVRSGARHHGVGSDHDGSGDGAGPISLLAHNAVRPLLARAVPVFARRGLRRAMGYASFPAWIDPGFARRASLEDRLERPYRRWRSLSLARQEMFELFEGSWTAAANEFEDRAAGWYGVERRSPFFDRRVMEFGFAIPEEQRMRAGVTKFVMRNAMRGLLPEGVRTRRTKSEFSHVFAQTFEKLEAAACAHFPATASTGWIRPEPARAALEQTLELYRRGDRGYARISLWQLWAALAVEMSFDGQSACLSEMLSN